MMMRSHLAFLRHIRENPISLYAETCREFRHDGSLRYCAVVNSEEERISIDRGGHLRDLNALYLCLWDECGLPLAVHLLGGRSAPVQSVRAVTVEAEHIVIVSGDGATLRIPITERNRNTIKAVLNFKD